MNAIFGFRDRQLDLNRRCSVMGILNCTPDSFSDGGRFGSREKAVAHALEMLDAGAEIIDIGGESTRPGAPEIAADEEIRRTAPVIAEIRKLRPASILSIDTRKAGVAAAALDAGADIVNDVSSLQYSPLMPETAAKHRAGLIIMHSRGTPQNMQSPEHLAYHDLIAEVTAELIAAADKAIAAGVPRNHIVLDPGIGFAKDTAQNIAILNAIPRLAALGFPILIGASRKSFIGKLSGESSPERRLPGSLAAAVIAAANGAAIIRVHDVPETMQALAIVNACLNQRRSS